MLRAAVRQTPITGPLVLAGISRRGSRGGRGPEWAGAQVAGYRRCQSGALVLLSSLEDVIAQQGGQGKNLNYECARSHGVGVNSPAIRPSYPRHRRNLVVVVTSLGSGTHRGRIGDCRADHAEDEVSALWAGNGHDQIGRPDIVPAADLGQTRTAGNDLSGTHRDPLAPVRLQVAHRSRPCLATAEVVSVSFAAHLDFGSPVAASRFSRSTRS